MSNEVHTFLQTIGAESWPGDECRFADETARLAELDNKTAIVPLSPHGLLAIEGVDAEKFLQGQITCSAADVSPTLSSPGVYCTPKGRMLTSFQLIRTTADRFLLRMRSDVINSTAQTFGKYIVFSKAKLQPLTGFIGIGVHGSNAAALVRELAGGIPQTINGALACAGGFALQRDTAGTWFECWLPAPAALDFWQRNRPQATAAGTNYWHWLNIRAGLAEISAATAEMFIPQMLNYHLTGAVNFKKGCYTGQEIVARAYYRGQVKRHLIRATFEGPAPAAGTAMNDANGRASGTVVNSVATAPGRAELLGVSSGDDANPVENLQINGINLQLAALPYAIP
jgi:folate-binding protein YgfZ